MLLAKVVVLEWMEKGPRACPAIQAFELVAAASRLTPQIDSCVDRERQVYVAARLRTSIGYGYLP